MCNRHVANMIAEYEAARLDGDEKGNESPPSSDSEQTAKTPTGLLATLKARLAR